MITVTAASSRFGRLVLDDLLRRGIAPSGIVAAARTTESLSVYAEQGVQVRHADYADPASLASALADVDRLLLISSGQLGQLAVHHRAAIDAAVTAGASEIVYTSFLNADSSGIAMAEDHVATEKMLRDCGVPFAVLRNGSYIENYADFVGFWLTFGNFTAAGGDGKVSGAARRDLAEAAATVITGPPAAGEVYELGGPPYTMADLAAEASKQSGVPIRYDNLSVPDYADILVRGTGMPLELATALADNSAGTARGGWYTDSTDLQRLVDRPLTAVSDVIATALFDAQSRQQS